MIVILLLIMMFQPQIVGLPSGDVADLLSYNQLAISNTMVTCDWGIMNLTWGW